MDTKSLTGKEKAATVQAYAAHTTGSDAIYDRGIGLDYTPGMKLVAETCEAYWLIDLVASWQPTIRKKLLSLNLRDFQVWRMKKDGDLWVVDVWTDIPDDDDSELLVQQDIEFSDFPAELLPFEFWVEHRTAMLKEER